MTNNLSLAIQFGRVIVFWRGKVLPVPTMVFSTILQLMIVGSIPWAVPLVMNTLVHK